MSTKHAVVYCGAGVDVDSGIPAFSTGDSAIWNQHSIEEVFNYRYWQKWKHNLIARCKIWQFYRQFKNLTMSAHPSEFHHYIANFVLNSTYKVTIVTTNITDLFEKAGVPSERVIYLHGNVHKVRCCACGHRFSFNLNKTNEEWHESTCPKQGCGGDIKPDVVFYHETGGLRYKEGLDAFHRLKTKEDVMIMAGSSGRTFSCLNKIWKKKRGRNVKSFQINPDLAVQKEYKASFYFSSCSEALQSPLIQNL